MDVVFLDVMDTLVRDPFRETMPAFFGMTLYELIPQLRHGAWVEFEKSERDEGSFLRDFFADGRDFDHERFLAAVTEAYEFLPGIPALLNELRDAGLRLYALSNYPCWYERIAGKLDLPSRLDGAFVSYQMGVRKPNAEAYLIPAREVIRAAPSSSTTARPTARPHAASACRRSASRASRPCAARSERAGCYDARRLGTGSRAFGAHSIPRSHPNAARAPWPSAACSPAAAVDRSRRKADRVIHLRDAVTMASLP